MNALPEKNGPGAGTSPPAGREHEPPLRVRHLAVELPEVRLATRGCNAALRRPLAVRTRRGRLLLRPPGVLSLKPGRVPVRLRRFRFPVAGTPWWLKEPAEGGPSPASSPAADSPNEQSRLRSDAAPRKPIRCTAPPEVVKLQDRLFYALQPSLDRLLGARRLALPHRPFPYQWEGIAFLYSRSSAILADEMGLGKTMQAVTAIRLLLHSGQASRVLLVCPKPLVTNWQREFRHWAPEVPLVVIQGNQAQRRWWWFRAGPVFLANYELVQRDAELLAGELAPFDLVVLDEAQRIKNRSGRTSRVVRAIPRRRSWALTGTPVENSTADLVGIFEFLQPGRLHESLPPTRLGKLAAPYVLRRTKDQVLQDLPPKLFRDVELELDPEQRESYRLAQKKGLLRLHELGEAVTIQHVFELVTRLKQICNFDPATGSSSKLEQLRADLEEVAASGQKALVFSQWVDTLRHLHKHLRPFGPLEYHGRIPPKRRDEVIARFRQDRRSRVLLISYGAGGVGLNLQFCRYVFLFDRWWNPAVEDQAINRAHRIGSAGPVTVTRYVTLDTIEERIEEILNEKRRLFRTIFSQGQQKLGLSAEELFGLFSLPCPEHLRRSA